MPEPMTIASALSTGVTTALKLTLAIYQTIDKIKSAPRHIKAMSRDLKTFYTILGSVSYALQDEELCQGYIHQESGTDFAPIIANCMTIFTAYKDIVHDYLRSSEIEKTTRWQAVKWTWKEQEVKEVRDKLAAQKLTLNVAIGLANLINSKIGLKTQQQLLREVRELKETLVPMLRQYDIMQGVCADAVVISQNYQTTIRQITHQPDAITTSILGPPSSPASCFSLFVSTVSSSSTYLTAREQTNNTFTYSTLDASSTGPVSVRSLPSNALPDVDVPQRHRDSFLAVDTTPECKHQIFVKGYKSATIVLLGDNGWDLTLGEAWRLLSQQIGPVAAALTLTLDGKMYRPDLDSTVPLSGGTTLHANALLPPHQGHWSSVQVSLLPLGLLASYTHTFHSTNVHVVDDIIEHLYVHYAVSKYRLITGLLYRGEQVSSDFLDGSDGRDYELLFDPVVEWTLPELWRELMFPTSAGGTSRTRISTGFSGSRSIRALTYLRRQEKSMQVNINRFLHDLYAWGKIRKGVGTNHAHLPAVT